MICRRKPRAARLKDRKRSRRPAEVARTCGETPKDARNAQCPGTVIDQTRHQSTPMHPLPRQTPKSQFQRRAKLDLVPAGGQEENQECWKDWKNGRLDRCKRALALPRERLRNCRVTTSLERVVIGNPLSVIGEPLGVSCTDHRSPITGHLRRKHDTH